jgi:hypothetical protein
MGNKIFVKEKITDFSKTPIEIFVIEDVVSNGNYYYIKFSGTAIPTAFKEFYPEQEKEANYLLFTMNLLTIEVLSDYLLKPSLMPKKYRNG